MTTVTIEQVQHDFASVRELIDRGETLAVEENGKLLGTFLPVPEKIPSVCEDRVAGDRIFGSLVGKIKVPDDFDEMMKDEIHEMFYGKP